MKSDLKDCSCLISQMRQVRGDVVKEAGGSGSGLRDFSSPIIKPKGISSKKGGGKKSVFQVNKQKYALYIWAPPPSSVFHKLLLSLELAQKIQYRLSEAVCCLVSLLVASFGHGCEPVGLTQTELSPMADTANGLSHRVSNILRCLPPLPPHCELSGANSSWEGWV